MRRLEAILAACMAFSSAGCVLRGKPKTASAVPPTPQPAARTAPATPPPPLSIPQTQVELPAPQPVNPEALATQPVEPPPERPPVPRPPRRQAASAAAQTRAETTPEPAAPPIEPAEPPRPPLQEIVPAEEQKRLQDSAAGRMREVRQILEELKGRRLSGHQRNVRDRILSFVELSDKAEKLGDMRQADALAERAQVLARELHSAR